MKYLKKHKKIIILSLFILSGLLLAVRIIFFLPDGRSNEIEKALFYLIAFLGVLIILLLLLPVKKKSRDFFVQYRDIFILIIYVLILETVFFIDNQLEFTVIIIFTLAFMASVIGLIALILPTKYKYILMFYIVITLPIYLIAQDFYINIFHEFFSFKEIVALKAGLEYASGVLHIRGIYYFYIVFSILALVLLILFKTNNQIKINKNTKQIFYIPLLIFALINLNAQYPINTARLYLSDHYLYTSIYHNTKFISRFGAINYSFRDFVDAVIPDIVSKKDLKEINQFYENHPKAHLSNDYSGIFEDKNLIFINAESFDSIAINEELTPNLVKLMNEGLHFSNHFVPVYPRTTCDSEIIFNTSIIPSIIDGPTCYIFNNNSYTYSLANLFANEGYEVNGYHSNRKEFYTRFKVYEGLGYQDFYGQDEIGLSHIEKSFDSIFIDKGEDLIIKEDTKFMSFVTTLSGHSPYNLTNRIVSKHYQEVDDYYGDTIPEEIKAYIATQIEVDIFVGKIFDALERKGILDDTVILFTGDHYPYTIQSSIYEEYKNVHEEYLKNRTPLYIWANNMTPTKIDKLSSSFDILPTLANMFNLETNYTYYFGYDVFSDDYEPVVFFKDYSWFDGENYVYDGELMTGNGDTKYIENKTEMIYEYFDISRKILKTDYFKQKDD